MAFIEVVKATKTYSGSGVATPALNGIDLSIERGEFVCIAGPSGSGKTSLLNLIGALDTPTSGTVSLDGVVTGALSRTALAGLRRAAIGVIFQSFNLIPVLTAYENVEYVLLLKGVSVRERRRRVEEVLADLGLTEYRNRRPSELSGGQQQRVAAARAIVGAPSLVLADEPTANLDSVTGKGLIELLHGINRSEGITFVFSSHDSRIIDRADRVIELSDGSLVSDLSCTSKALKR